MPDPIIEKITREAARAQIEGSKALIAAVSALTSMLEKSHEKTSQLELKGVKTIELKGDKGDTPVFGKDFLTPDEMKFWTLDIEKGVLNSITPTLKTMVDAIKPIKGKDYDDGKPGAPGKPGKSLTWEDLSIEQKASLKGEPGAPGRGPKHEWEGTKIRFEHAPGIWGSWHDLQGPAGESTKIKSQSMDEYIPRTTGATRFEDLRDVAQYKNNAGKAAIVNATMDGLIFASISGTDEKAGVEAGDTAGYLGAKIIAGSGVTVTITGSVGARTLTIASSGSVNWGSIGGTLASQTDLQSALNAKQNSITTGSTSQYFRGDLSLATFPTSNSSFTNGAGYITSVSGGDHNSLTNLTTGDVHTQYALLAGRAGGQTYTGGNAASENLTLLSTSHATKGKIIFGALGTTAYDAVNDRFGFGTASPTQKIDVNGNINIPVSSSTVGVIYQNGTRFVHSYGTTNTFVGFGAGNLTFNTSFNSSNVGIGSNALSSLAGTSGFQGSFNFGLGNGAGSSITTGFSNVLIGNSVGTGITSTSYNTIIGDAAGFSSTGLDGVVYIGRGAGRGINTFTDAVFLGTTAGGTTDGGLQSVSSLTNVIALGARSYVGASNTMALGSTGAYAVDIIAGGSVASAKLHLIKTSEQFRVGYDASNYYSTIVGSTGSVTFDAVGSGAAFNFNDRVKAVTGTASKYSTLGGKIKEFYTSIGNIGLGEDDLYTYTTEAGLLALDGGQIEGSFGLKVVASGGTATRQIKLWFGGTAIFDSSALLYSGASAVVITYKIVRVSATSIRYRIAMTTQGATLAAYTAVDVLAGLTLSNTNVLKLTGEAAGVGAATDDIVAHSGDVFWWPPSI